MKIIATVLAAAVTGAVALHAQRPSDPALMVPQQAPRLDVEVTLNPLPVPDGMTMGAPAAVAFDARGHLFVLTRGALGFFEYDDKGTFVRAFGERLFSRAHGLRIDREGNLWATDVNAHTVTKFTRDGTPLLTIGTRGEAGDWNEATGSHKLDQPNDVAIAANGDIFIAQGHLPVGGDPRVLKFDRTGKFLMSWGGKGTAPGKFAVAHGIALDAGGRLWVSDRENQRVQVFSQDGQFVREMKYAGLPCAVDLGAERVYMVNGFASQLLELDKDGKVVAAIGGPGKGPAEFGEAHFMAVSPKGEIYVADSVNGTLQKFVRK